MDSAVNTPLNSDSPTTSQSINLNREPITRRAATIILLLLPVVFAAPIILAGYSLTPRADMDGTLGLHLTIGRNIAEGAPPFLNPYILSAPLLFATVYSGALYPPSWLFAIFSPTTSTDIFIITSYYIALFGLYLFGRRTSMTRLGAIISSAAFTFGVLGGLSAAGIGNSSNIASAAWIPWIMLAIECIAQKAGARWVLLGAAFIALQGFAGDLQIGLLTVLTALAYTLFRSKQRDRNNPFLIGAAIMLIGGALLTAIQLLPIKEKLITGSAGHVAGELLPTSDIFLMRIPILGYLLMSAGFAVIISLRSRLGGRSLTSFWATTAAITLSIAAMTPETLERTLYWIPIYGLFRSSATPLFISGFTVAALMGTAISRFPDLRNNAISRQVAAIILLSAIPTVFAFSANLRDNRSKAAIYNRLQDPPAVQYIKSREKDLNSFRVLKYDMTPGRQGKGLEADPRQAIRPELRYVNGAPESAHPEIAAIAGDLNENGEATNFSLFATPHKGLDLLGIKYVLVKNKPAQNTENSGNNLVEIDGVEFPKDILALRLPPRNHLDITIRPTMASELVFVSNMGGSINLTDGATICDVKLHTKDGRILSQKIQAGRDTAEWCYDRPDLLNNIKHKKARVAESFAAEGFSAHHYIGRLPFDPAEITRIEMDRAESIDFLITRLALYDGAARKSTPITPEDLLTNHLRKIEQFDDIAIYQNDNYRPAAWFVNRAAVQSGPEVIGAIKSGSLPDNSKFDVSETALLERGSLRTPERDISTENNSTDSAVTILSQSPNGIEMTTQNNQSGFLVINLPYHRGWTAHIDGQRQAVERVDYALLGIAVPAGAHRVNVTFNPLKAGKGTSYFILGVLILSLAAMAFGLRRRGAVRLSPDLILRIRGVGNRSVEWCRSLADSALKYRQKIVSSKLPVIIGVAGLIIYGSVLIWRAGYGIGGCDSYGYASLGKTVSRLKATEPVKELAEFNLSQDYIDLFIPIANLRGPEPGTMSNVYSVGLPLQAAAAAAIFGWDIGPFLIGPLSAALSVLLMYLIGLEFGLSRKLSAAGAILLGTFPTIISQGLVLMTDVPAMLWCMVAVFAALRSRKNQYWAIAAGFAFGVSILIRPPNALLLFPIFFAMPISIKSLIRFGLGGLPTAVLFCLYNSAAYGSPFEVGHAAAGQYDLFKFTLFTTHLSQFVYWISILMSPLALFSWIATVVNKSVHWRDRCLIISWFAGFYLFWCFYDIEYDYDGAWWYTRYLLPGVPAVILGFLLIIRYISDLFISSTDNGAIRATAKFLAPLLLLPVFLTSASRVHLYNLYDSGVGQEEMKKATQWAGKIMPEKSVVVSADYSGTVPYYINRSSLRYDQVTPEKWGAVKDRVKEKGYQLYALLIYYEPDTAKRKIPGKWSLIDTFNGHTTLWRIDPE
jgi:hypothetical protein